MKRFLAILAMATLTAMPALAVNPDEMLADPALEARAREISKGLRCVVCRNQNIDDSNAAIARDMRLLLRERLAEGDTDEEAIAFFVARYGSFVLLKPPLRPDTYLLWIGPLLILLAAGTGFALFLRNRRQDLPANQLSDEDKRLLESLLRETE